MEMDNPRESVNPTARTNQPLPTKPINNPRGASLIILGGLVLLLAVASGSYFLGTHNKSNPQQTLRPTITDSRISDIPHPTNDSIENWKTFINPAFPFTFQYPRDTEIIMTANVATSFTLVIPKNEPSNGYMNLGFEFIKSNRSLKEHAIERLERSKSDKEEILVPMKGISVNGFVGLTYTAQETQGFGYTTRYFFVKSPDTNYIVSISEIIVGEDTLRFKEKTDQILSTFKFSPQYREAESASDRP